jgi:hypothetical protein
MNVVFGGVLNVTVIELYNFGGNQTLLVVPFEHARKLSVVYRIRHLLCSSPRSGEHSGDGNTIYTTCSAFLLIPVQRRSPGPEATRPRINTESNQAIRGLTSSKWLMKAWLDWVPRWD